MPLYIPVKNSRVPLFTLAQLKGKVCIRASVVHQAGAYHGFCSMKRLGVFLLPPGWDASPSQGYPPALSSLVPIYTPGWREALWELSILPKNTTQCPWPGLETGLLAPESSALTMRPPHLPTGKFLNTPISPCTCVPLYTLDYNLPLLGELCYSVVAYNKLLLIKKVVWCPCLIY